MNTAKTTEFGRPLINSIFTLGLMVGLSVQDTTLGTGVASLTTLLLGYGDLRPSRA